MIPSPASREREGAHRDPRALRPGGMGRVRGSAAPSEFMPQWSPLRPGFNSLFCILYHSVI